MPTALSVDKTMTKAKQASKSKDWVTAQALYQQVLDRFPSNKRAAKAVAELRVKATPDLLNAAKSAEANEEWVNARKALEAAAALAPDIPEITTALAECLLEAGEQSKALALAERALEKSPQDITYLNIKGRALHELDQPEVAIKALQAVLALEPENASALRSLGLIARSQGQKAQAAEYFARSLVERPKDAALHLQYAKVHTYKAGDPHIDQLRNTIAALGKDNPESGLAQFAMFEALHALEDHEAAFPYLAQGNALYAKKYKFDLRAGLTLAAFSKVLFANPLPEQPIPSGKRIIFVTGLPRSGTTLTERILSRAPNVQACGELSFVEPAVGECFNTVNARKDKRLLPEDIAALREDLLARFAGISDGSDIQIDKMPLNFRWIGYICAALPEARIVHLNRDSKAVAWSLYRNKFKRGSHDFMYKAEDIAGFMVMHREVMKHWRQVCGSRLFDLSYSDLVTRPAETTQALAAAVGLDWSEDWTSPEKATTHVRTSSAGQVSQPMYTGSDEGWKTYETQLAPMMRALASVDLA